MRRAAVALATIAVTACSLLTSYDGFDVPKKGAVDASGIDAQPDTAPPDTCGRRRWPPPPPSGSSADLGELVSALQVMKTINKAGLPYGFDLDNLCSCPERVACIGAKPNEPCDPDAGIDNAAANLFELFSTATQTSLDETGLRSGLDSGRFSVAFRLNGWNGEPDDPEVVLQILNVFGANDDAGAKFDGNDTWVIDTESFIGSFPLAPVLKAYVSGGVLVAELASLVFKARIPTLKDQWLLLRVALRDVHVTATITRTGNSFTLTNGQLGGRSPTADLITLASNLGACAGSAQYDTMKPILCNARDVPINPGDDGRDLPCEAVSLGVLFETSPAKVAPIPRTPVDFFPCADAGIGDCQ